jgi:ribulose-phosphate 3-epimerase
MQIFPSVLAADLLNLESQIGTLIQYNIDAIHLDIMDNHYVPNLSFSADLCHSIRQKYPKLIIDVHLMTNPVDKLIKDFADAGANRIAIHPNSTIHLDYSLQLIKQLNCQAGIVLNPADSIEAIHWTKYLLDYVLIMTVNPGFGGQKLIQNVIPKIEQIKHLFPDLILEVDGGVDLQNIKSLQDAGCEHFVIGSALFKAKNFPECINTYKNLLKGN